MDRDDAYRTIRSGLRDALPGCPDRAAAMELACELIQRGLPNVLWVGFYLLEPDGTMRLGPFRGPPACERIPAGRGVCGQAARERATVIVPDVGAHADHITCDSRARSEIVIPLQTGEGVLAVLDLDSEQLADFGETDRIQLESVAAEILRLSP